MTTALRSPGSTLKPFIFGLAIEEGLGSRRRSSTTGRAISGYYAGQFRHDLPGHVTVREALQLSLNVPAIRLLDGVGPSRLSSRLSQAGAVPVLPKDERRAWRWALAARASPCWTWCSFIALGAAGRPGRWAMRDAKAGPRGSRGFRQVAAWQVGDILFGIPRPKTACTPDRVQDRHQLWLSRRLVDRL